MSDADTTLDWLLAQIDEHNNEYDHRTQGHHERAAVIREALLDAKRWRSLMACERIRVIGGADLGTPHALLGMDFHRKHPARDDVESRRMFLEFVDGVSGG